MKNGQIIQELVHSKKCQVRLMCKADNSYSGWGKTLIFPAENYIEIHEPFSLKEVAFIELNTLMLETKGRLMPEVWTNYMEEVEERLNSLQVPFEKISGNVIRYYV